MAINFNKLKDPKLGMLDNITFGKLSGCRVCDVIQDHYEYLIWCEKQGFVKFQQDVTDLILEQANFEKWQPPVEPEVESIDTALRRKLNAFHGGYSSTSRDYTFSDMEDDIPF